MSSPFFNAHRSPVGAFASLTLGQKGSKGGHGLGLAGSADEMACGGSTSRDSWLSKIYLCQYFAERILGHGLDTDAAYLACLLDSDNACYAWGDQMLLGKAFGSPDYPSGVTRALWLAKGERPLPEVWAVLGEGHSVEVA